MRFSSTISFVFVAICVVQQGDAVNSFRKTAWSRINDILRSKFPETAPLPRIPTPGKIIQQLDHYDVTNTQTWEQRFFVNNVYFQGDGPVFLFIGGEGTASPLWLQPGYSMMMEWAAKYGALTFELEHRYYGQSQPTPDVSTENLKYLSSGQALADLAYFIESKNAEYQLTSKNKWIVFGGSYAGAMAAWFRLKYPHLVHGAVASSGPVLAQVNFQDYYKVVARSLETSPQGTACTAAIQQATTALNDAVNSANCCGNIEQQFKLCSPLDKNNKNDVSSLFEYMAGNFAGIIQYNGFYSVDLNDLCNIMTDTSLGDPLARYAAVNTRLLSLFGGSCADFTYASWIDYLKGSSWSDQSAQDGYRQWFYQTCTEFGYYQSSDSKEQPFGSQFPIDYLVAECAEVYGSQFNPAAVQAAVDRTNSVYGGLGLELQRTVFPNGSIDPWHALGVITNATGNLAIYIDGTSHCADMYPPSASDSAQLVVAKKIIEDNLDSWLLA